MIAELPRPSRKLFPDLERCRARATTFGYVECQVDRPALCPYSLSFGFSYFCLHPERESIVARTEEAANQRQNQ